MTELDVVLTDYILAIICTAFAWVMHKQDEKDNLVIHLWCIFFGSVAIASLMGGTVHGFYSHDTTFTAKLFWIVTLLAIGVTAGCSWVLGGFFINGRHQITKWIIFAGFLFVIYAGIVIFYTHNFSIAIINYLPALMFLLVVTVWCFIKTQIPAYCWITTGIFTSFIAAVIQQAGIGFHPLYFNNNSTYHLLQAFAFWLIFKGAKGLLTIEKKCQ